MLSVGHLTANKGFELLIKAVKILSEEFKQEPPLLVIVGGGKHKKVLDRLIASLEMGSTVSLVGSIPHHELGWYYSAADVFSLASEREGWPNVILEALACGRPVIAPPVGGIPEIISSPKVGMLVKRDATQFARSIRQAFLQEWSVQDIVTHARSFSWEQTAQSLYGVFQSALAEKSTCSVPPKYHSSLTQ